MITVQDIEAGLAQHQFCLYYQPKYSLAGNRIEGSEALIRWRQPDDTLRQPGEFIALASRSGLIRKISAYIVEELLAALPLLAPAGFTPASFNLTAGDFEDGLLTGRLLAALAAHEVAPGQVEVELTEDSVLAYSDTMLANVQQLCDGGIGLAMDDYGIGYSSVDTLSKWPFSTIKIDQGLIGRMLVSDKSARIVHSAIRMAHELDIDSVAEGVETEAQLRFLLEAGCGKVQGYLISRPLPLADLATLGLGGVQSRSLPVGQIHMAIVDHIQWRKQLVQYAITMANLPADAPERQSQMPFCMAGHNCLLVRWYHGDGQVFERMPGFSRIGVALVDMAKVSQQLVAGIHAGAGPNDIADLIGEIQQISQDMLDVLTTLETNTMAGLDQWAVH